MTNRFENAPDTGQPGLASGHGPAVDAFLAHAGTLSFGTAQAIDDWNEHNVVPGYDDASHAAKALLAEPALDNPVGDDGFTRREVEWDELWDRLALPRWYAAPHDVEWLIEGLAPVLRSTLLALYLQPHLEPKHVDALTASWRAVIDPAAAPVDTVAV